MSLDASTSQWERLLLNLGAWQGSFSRFSPQGVLQEDTPTLVTLEGLNENQTIRQTIQLFSLATGELVQNKVLEYSSLSRSTLFFADGAFSQGSMQFAPFSEFGAELGFIQSDRRLRLVQLFDKDGHFSRLTLIREHRQHTPKTERPPLSVEMLLGNWQGTAITLYPDWRTPEGYVTSLQVHREGNLLRQQLTTPQWELVSTGEIAGSIVRFQQGHYPIQLLLLPDGASSNTPLTIPKGEPFFLEAGWLIAKNLRQRMIRRYDAKGGWVSLTLVTERKVEA
ncbi:DUF3598 family protein [Thermocoleostomius sinensis]|uniref:DUF3598 family protein n=1 Tax=Thermocoleostomius sinensis A174 TaxID=2016057 RepID=A0A9E8ZE49_9CYAN|nr:DUF3598 family protein [Thermocoleostomius sinensis]WAL60224.1 DUF3598 family protein [Thermocoleostomius sinensis A174]